MICVGARHHAERQHPVLVNQNQIMEFTRWKFCSATCSKWDTSYCSF